MFGKYSETLVECKAPFVCLSEPSVTGSWCSQQGMGSQTSEPLQPKSPCHPMQEPPPALQLDGEQTAQPPRGTTALHFSDKPFLGGWVPFMQAQTWHNSRRLGWTVTGLPNSCMHSARANKAMECFSTHSAFQFVHQLQPMLISKNEKSHGTQKTTRTPQTQKRVKALCWFLFWIST